MESAGTGTGLRMRLAAAGAALRNPDLARLLVSWGCWITGDWGVLVALSVVAYDRSGAAAVGLVGVVRVLPGAVLGPLVSLLSDRRRRPRVLASVHAWWCLVGLALALMAAVDASLGGLLVVLGAGSVVAAVFKPCVNALVPQLVRSPGELVAANAAYSLLEAAGTVAGPLIAGLLLAVAGPAPALAGLAAVFAAAAVVSVLIRTEYQPARVRRARGVRVLLEPLRGFPVLVQDAGTRAVIAVLKAQVVMRGLLNVFVVVLAVEAGGNAEGRAGALFAAIGIGGLVGALGTLGAGGGAHSARWFALGATLWGLPVLVVGLWPRPAVALVALAVLGLGNAVLDVNGFTLLHRLIPDHLAGRAFGAMWSAADGGLALGSVLAPVLIGALGLPSAMVVSGALLAAFPILLWPVLRTLDQRTGVDPADVALLRGVPVFAPMSGMGVERLARSIEALDVPAGEPVVRQGEPGRLYYVVRRGSLLVTEDGVERRRLGPGDSFGEIALLHAVPRTATVTALEPCDLLAVDGEVFVAAVTGHRGADAAARDTIDRLLPRRPHTA